MVHVESKVWMIEELENKTAMIIDCPGCHHRTFVGVAQGYTSNDEPYPIGECAQCQTELRKLDESTDVSLMMEFRSENWDEWVKFCIMNDYKPCVE
jgi:hypothetical protein